jgi:hypothetical protein
LLLLYTLSTGLQEIASIHGNYRFQKSALHRVELKRIELTDLSIQVLGGGRERDSRCHVPITSWSLGREVLFLILGQVALLILVALLGRYLTWEYAGCYTINPNLEASIGDFRCQHLREMVCCALGSVVCEVVLASVCHA